MNIFSSIKKLACYALEKGLIEKEEWEYSINLLLDVLNLDEFVDDKTDYKNVDLQQTLEEILSYAYENKLIKENTTLYRDLFDTKVMNCFTPRPSSVIHSFQALEKENPKKATDYFYSLSLNSDYIRSYRIKKDIKWKYPCVYGDLDITINLSKPEKDPKSIALARLEKKSSYPECMLCKENIGYRGNLNHPARETIRYIPLNLALDSYYLQYSPYSYYPEHCIVFNKEHTPMAINHKTFLHLFSFVDLFPHYMIGSNADLPIVGGSILSHDHYQGGNYIFPMFQAKEGKALFFTGFEDVDAFFLYWPLSVIRLKSKNKDSMIRLADKILSLYRNYSDESINLCSFSENTPHNTITPILHKEKDTYVLDLTLRNNITNEEYPLGYFHPHKEYWNIKKENIGLIEVMGMAILPSRLKQEMAILKEDILLNKDIASDERVSKHASFVNSFKEEIEANKNDLDSLLKAKIGEVFKKVLECCGVFKQDEKGYTALDRFVSFINEH